MAHAGAVGERAREPRSHHHEREPEAHADQHAQFDQAARHRACVAGARGAEEAPDHRLACDRQRVERECEEEEHLHADLLRSDGVVADARRDRGGREQRDEQRRRAHDQPAPDAGVVPHAGRVRAQRGVGPARGTGDDQEVGERGAVLGEDRAPRRTLDAEVERVDEEQLDREVGDVGHHGDDERGRGVLHAAQVARTGEREQERGRPEDADAQVVDREGRHAGARAHHVDDERRRHEAEHGQCQSQAQREPAAVDSALGRVLAAARPELAGHPRGRAVGEEVEHAERRRQHRAGDGQTGERAGAEVPDDRGVGEEVQRLGRQGTQRRDGEAGDLPVVRTAGSCCWSRWSRRCRSHWFTIVSGREWA